MADDYSVGLDGRWELPELAEFARLYSQCYAFMYSLERESEDEETRPFEEVQAAYPWRGGWSAVNYYHVLYARVPARDKPTLLRISYASPGFVTLGVATQVAVGLGALIASVAGSIALVEATYHRIYKHAQERRLLSLDVRVRELDFARHEREFIEPALEELASVLRVDPTTILMQAPTSLGALKILLSFTRRVLRLADMQAKGKLKA